MGPAASVRLLIYTRHAPGRDLFGVPFFPAGDTDLLIPGRDARVSLEGGRGRAATSRDLEAGPGKTGARGAWRPAVQEQVGARVWSHLPFSENDREHNVNQMLNSKIRVPSSV